jgi:hypothetical protein
MSRRRADLNSGPLVPLVMTLPTLAAVADVVQVEVPHSGTAIRKVSGSLRALTSGTQAYELKNLAGTLLATISWTAAGRAEGSISDANIGADWIRVSCTSAGVGAVDGTITVWIEMDTL